MEYIIDDKGNNLKFVINKKYTVKKLDSVFFIYFLRKKSIKDEKRDYKSRKRADKVGDKGAKRKNGMDVREVKGIKGSAKSARDTKSKYPSKKRY